MPDLDATPTPAPNPRPSEAWIDWTARFLHVAYDAVAPRLEASFPHKGNRALAYLRGFSPQNETLVVKVAWRQAARALTLRLFWELASDAQFGQKTVLTRDLWAQQTLDHFDNHNHRLGTDCGLKPNQRSTAVRQAAIAILDLLEETGPVCIFVDDTWLKVEAHDSSTLTIEESSQPHQAPPNKVRA
jgi:hypothetical protein